MLDHLITGVCGNVVLSAHKGFVAHRAEPVKIGLAEESDPSTYRYDNRSREQFCLFQYTVCGEGAFEDMDSGKQYAVPAGSAMLFQCPSSTCYWLPRGKTWRFIYLLYVGDMATWHTREILNRAGPVFALPKNSGALKTIGSLCQQSLAGVIPDKFTASLTLYRFLMALHREVAADKADIPDCLETVLRFVEEQYDDSKIGIEEMASCAELSRYHFSRLFLRHVGISPYAYLQQLRIRKAVDLLNSTRLPIKQIGFLVGFGDQAYFCSAFKKQMGVSPGSLRK
jgi:AraC-like DNA-binding protein